MSRVSNMNNQKSNSFKSGASSRGRFSGRGRGRGRGYNRSRNGFNKKREPEITLDGALNKYNKYSNIYKKNPTKDSWEQRKKALSCHKMRCDTSILRSKEVGNMENYYPVGSEEWGLAKKMLNYHNRLIYEQGDVKYECDDKLRNRVLEPRLNINISETLENLGWEYDVDTDKFKNIEYGDMEYDYIVVDYLNKKYKLPTCVEDKYDKHGLCFKIVNEGAISKWKQNNWVEFWDTRRGVKTLKYIDYRERRKIRKQEIEKEKQIKLKNNAEINKSMHKV